MKKNMQSQSWFRNIGKGLLAWRWGILAGVIVLNLLAGLGVREIRLDNSRKSWFLDNDPIMLATDAFEETFGNNDYAAVLIEADDVFTADILRMIRTLGEDLVEHVPYATEVVSLADFEFTLGTEEGVEIEQIVPEDIPESPDKLNAIREKAFSKDFLVNRLFSDDGKLAWVLLRLEAYPEDWEATLPEHPEQLVGKAVVEIVAQEKYQAYTLKSAGRPVKNYEHRVFVMEEAVKLVELLFLLAVLILFAFLRTLRGVFVPMFSAVTSVLWVFGTLGALGIEIDSTMLTLPIFLGLAVSIGYSIHLFNFFTDRFHETGQRHEAILYTLEETGVPIFFTAATTIGGLLSFYFVPIQLVREMGLEAALTIFAVYVLVMSLTPIFLSFGKNVQAQTPKHRPEISQRADRVFTGFSLWVLTHKKGILTVLVVLMSVLLLFGVSRVNVSMDLKRSQGMRIPHIARLVYVGNTKIGSLYSYNVLVNLHEVDRAKNPDILKNLDQLSQEILEFPLVKRTSSLLDVIKDMNQVLHDGKPEYYRIPDDQNLIAQLLLLYEMSSGTEQENWVDYEYSTLRLMVEVSDFDTGKVEKELESIEQSAQSLFPEADIELVGGLVQFSRMQNYIVKGELFSFFIALGVIGLLLMLVFRSVKVGLIGMIPNVVPAIVIGGVMGFADIPLDMLTMTIVPMSLGLAVDDTIHFISHAQTAFQRTLNYRKSIDTTFRTIGKAIFMTSFILIGAFSIYLTSLATFFVHFGMLLMLGIGSALLADYFVTPVLIVWTHSFGHAAQEISTAALTQNGMDS